MIQLTFEQPALLWFLLGIPLLVVAHFFALRHAKSRALVFANFRALKRVTGESLITRNYALLALRLLIVLCAVLAVAGATLWYEGRSASEDFVLAIDTSSSMTAQDIAPTRLDAAKEDAALFLDSLDGQARVGVLSFAGVALIEQTPTTDLDDARAALARLAPMQAGGTDIPAAIITGTNLLLDNERGRAIILLTDGSSTIETFLDASLQRAVTYAQERHVKVHTIGVGTNDGPIGYLPEYYNVSSVYNEDNLLRIANATGGRYAKADDRDALLAAFSGIAAMEDEQLLRRDLRAPLMLAALVLLLVEWTLVNTRFRRLP